MDWLATLRARLCPVAGQSDVRAVVRVTVAAIRGSAPREPGACMLVGADWEDGTIGGGHLELMATGIAKKMLTAETEISGRLDRFPLGATLGQCCGGVVELWFERFTSASVALVEEAIAMRQSGKLVILATSLSPTRASQHKLIGGDSIGNDAAFFALLREGAGASRAILKRGAGDYGSVDVLYERLDASQMPLWIFGAGHVGKALVNVLAPLPFDLTWIDSRDSMFPAQIPDRVRVVQCEMPADAVEDAPAGALFLILTHSHDMDFDICRAILARGDFAWAGLIGSKTKAARFVQRMQQRGFSGDCIARIVCPIGIDGISSKVPAAIAIAVAAQMLQVAESLQVARAQSETITQGQS